MELTHIKGNTYALLGPANVGVYVDDGHSILIDSGNDREAGKKIHRIIESQGWTLSLIINTHSNADHIGGNSYLQQKTGCRIAATRIEKAFIEDPFLEPAFLNGGFPLAKMQSKFLMAQPSRVTDVIGEGPIPGTPLAAVHLPGHYFGMIGVKTPDDAFFIADTLFSSRILEKYPIFFLLDIASHISTLDMLASDRSECFVPSHAEITSDIRELIRKNQEKIEEISSFICSCTDKTAEEILDMVCSRYNLGLDENQYILVLNTIRSYLAYLHNTGRMSYRFSCGRMIWEKKK